MTTTSLERLIEPFTEFLTPEAAAKIVGLKADEATQKRVDELAEKANFGTITSEESVEYDQILAWYHMVTVIQARARRILKAS